MKIHNTLTHISLITIGSLLLHTASASLLFDEFIAGDGSGVTYTTGSIGGQQGGSGWVPDAGWILNGNTINMQINAGNYLSINSNTPNSGVRQIRRNYQTPAVPLSSMQIRTTVELTNLSGYTNILSNEDGTVTTSGGSGNIASNYFAFFPRVSSDAGAVTTSSMWYLEASAGYWHALPGSTNTGINYGAPVQVAPLVEGETYEIAIYFSGDDTWAVAITALGTGTTYDSGWLEYIGDGKTDADLTNDISYRAVHEAGNANPTEIRVHNLYIIPEPATYGLLLGAGMLGFILVRRRLNRS